MNSRLSLLCLAVSALLACDGSMQSVSLTAEDFSDLHRTLCGCERRLHSLSPCTMPAREVHEFDSPILMYAAKISLPKETSESAGTPGIVIRPGQSLQITMAPPAGTYLYICRRKGHANMTGTLIVE